MTGSNPAEPTGSPRRRLCTRAGCQQPVKKSTAKYCSVGCSSTDPQRLAQLRERSRSSARQVIPMARQLTMPLSGAGNAEELLARLCEGREDTPQGLSRLVC